MLKNPFVFKFSHRNVTFLILPEFFSKKTFSKNNLLTCFSSPLIRPVSDNRASLLRSSAPPKKTNSESQRDSLSRLWKNQVIMAMRLVPPIPSIAIRCASPDLSLRYVFSNPYNRPNIQTLTCF